MTAVVAARPAQRDDGQHLVAHEHLALPGEDQAPGRDARDGFGLIGTGGVLVMGAVKNLERPEADHHGGERQEHDQAHDREPEAETGAFLAPLAARALRPRGA